MGILDRECLWKRFGKCQAEANSECQAGEPDSRCQAIGEVVLRTELENAAIRQEIAIALALGDSREFQEQPETGVSLPQAEFFQESMVDMLNQQEEALEEFLGEISASEDSVWTSLLKLKKEQLIDRLTSLEGLKLVTLGLMLWGRHSDGATKGGLKANPLAIDNKQLLTLKLKEWRGTDLADFLYQIEYTTTYNSTLEWLDSVSLLLNSRLRDKLWQEDSYRDKIIELVNKVLDNREAGKVLWLLVKEI